MAARRHMGLLVGFLLLGAALRLLALGELAHMLDYDEAYYAIDALSLLDEPRLVPFFTDNYGRESLWMYTLLPLLAVLGPEVLALRVTAAFIGILTLAAAYRAAVEVLDQRAAAWTVGALAVLYWHVHLSHLGFRALLVPLMGALALWALLRAYRRRSWRTWLIGGALLGTLAYTYIAARVWIGLLALLLGLWGAQGHGRRRGVLLAGGMAVAVSWPLIAFLQANPAIANSRLTSEAVTLATIVQNAGVWLQAWLWQGSTYYFHNAAGRPILDAVLALLVGLGLVALAQGRRKTLAGLVLLLLAAVLPSLLSDEAPHYLRAVGVIIPLVLLAGSGGAALERWLARRAHGHALAWVLPAMSIVWAGWWTGQDLQHWAAELTWPAWRQIRLERLQAMEAWQADPNIMPAGQRWYYAADSDDAPLMAFMLADAPAEPLEIFDFPPCLIGYRLPFDLVAPLAYVPDQAVRWGALELRYADPAAAEAGWGYGIYSVSAPDDVALGNWGAALHIARAAPLPVEAAPGDRLSILLRVSALLRISRPYTLFLHLYPAREERLMAQTDVPLCPNYPPARWYPDRAALLPLTLQLPPDLAPGIYQVMLGVYDSTTYARLTWGGTPYTTLRLGSIRIH